MKIDRLEQEQKLPIALERAWDFFSDPCNLARITPPYMSFQITCELQERMHPGMIVTYVLHPFPHIPVRWVTEITHVQEPVFFVDEQRFGPYRFWHHQHHFEAIPGGVRMRDIVHYALPLRPFSRLLDPLVRRQLRGIFSYRREALTRAFGEWREDFDPVPEKEVHTVI